jgi:hypothetical protein
VKHRRRLGKGNLLLSVTVPTIDFILCSYSYLRKYGGIMPQHPKAELHKIYGCLSLRHGYINR